MKLHPKICQICGVSWTPANRYQAARNKTCSPQCKAALSSKTKRESAAPSRKWAWTTIVCPVCGELFTRQNAWLRRVKTPVCSNRCNGKLRSEVLVKNKFDRTGMKFPGTGLRGEHNPAWKGGVTYWRKRGNYKPVKYVRCPEQFIKMARKDGYVMEHRLIMATIMGRPLTREEVVHHINHDPQDNRPENLELFPDNRAHKKAEWEHAKRAVG